MSDIVKITYIQQDGKKIVAESEPGRLEIDSSEDGTLDLSDARSENSRLSCQIPITPELDGLVVTVATVL